MNNLETELLEAILKCGPNAMPGSYLDAVKPIALKWIRSAVSSGYTEGWIDRDHEGNSHREVNLQYKNDYTEEWLRENNLSSEPQTKELSGNSGVIASNGLTNPPSQVI